MTVVPLPATDARRPQFRRHAWEPLTMAWEEVADRVFRRDAAWLRENLPADFPRPDPVYHLFHVKAVETWARRRWGVVPAAGDDEDRIASDMRRGEKAAAFQGRQRSPGRRGR